MRFPEWLYKFTSQTHEGSQPIEAVHRRTVSTSNATSIQLAPFTVPGDFFLVLSSMCLIVDAPNLVTALLAQLEYRLAQSNIDMAIASNQDVGSVAENMTVDWSGEIWLPPGTVVSGLGVFDVANANNTVSVFMHGILIPRGSISWSG